jgi:hypothetical protein
LQGPVRFIVVVRLLLEVGKFLLPLVLAGDEAGHIRAGELVSGTVIDLLDSLADPVEGAPRPDQQRFRDAGGVFGRELRLGRFGSSSSAAGVRCPNTPPSGPGTG